MLRSACRSLIISCNMHVTCSTFRVGRAYLQIYVHIMYLFRLPNYYGLGQSIGTVYFTTTCFVPALCCVLPNISVSQQKMCNKFGFTVRLKLAYTYHNIIAGICCKKIRIFANHMILFSEVHNICYVSNMAIFDYCIHNRRCIEDVHTYICVQKCDFC